MEPIETQGLTKRYGSLTAVDDVSFQARKGEILGFLGPNGAGKSTTIKMLVGLVSPTEGRAFLNGHDATREPIEARRALGYLPEVVSVYGDMTARQFLRYSGRFYDLSDATLTRRVEELLDSVGIGHAASRKMRTYSKGMRQRAALAAALIHEPEVLILDEPLTGLDPVGVIEMREAILRLGREKTIMLSSHELHAVETLCDRVVIVAKGRILADERVDTLTAGAHPRYVLRSAVARDDLASLAAAAPNVREAQVVDERACRLVLDDAKSAPGVVARLVQEGVPVAEFSPTRETLEEVFIRVTGVRQRG